MVKRTRNASVDLGPGVVAPAVDDAPTASLDQPTALGGGELADGGSAQPTSPSSDPSALKRRRLTRSGSADKTPSVSPTKAALAMLEQVGEEATEEQEQVQQGGESTDADLALLTALAQEHAAELDGILGEQDVNGETALLAPDASDAEDAVDTRRLGSEDAARLLKIYEAMTAGNPHLESVLDQPPQAATDPALQSTLRQLLSASDEPLRSAVQATLEALAGGEDASDAFYAQRVAVRDTADLKRARELAAFGRDAVRVLDSVGGGRKGKGVGKPKRKIALYQKIASHPSHPTQLFGPRYFTEPIEVDSDEEFEDTGYANVIEIHPSPELPAEQQPTLGQSSRPRQRRLKPVPATKETGRLVSIIPREDPFSSFLPSYDSSVATLSLSETIGRLRKAEALELARDEAQVAPLPAWSPLEHEPRAGETAAAESVDAMLKQNWERLARLKAAQVARVRKGIEMAVEDESATAQQLAETLAQLIAFRPSPSVVPSKADVRALHSIVGLDNPPPSYRGTLDGARQLALADNTTLKVVYAQPPAPAPPPQQQQQQQQQAPSASRQGSYGPAPTSGGQTYRPSPAQRAPTYPQQQQQPYQPSPRQGYAPQSQGNSPLYATGSPYPQHQPPPPQWQQGPTQSYRPPPPHQQQPLAPYASQQAYSQQQSAPIPMMGWKSGTSSATPLPPSVQAASSNYPEGMW